MLLNIVLIRSISEARNRVIGDPAAVTINGELFALRIT